MIICIEYGAIKIYTTLIYGKFQSTLVLDTFQQL